METGRRHTRSDVADAALRILDDYGLQELTMRRLAGVLDVQPSALYWHFPNKQTMLAELADRIVAHAWRTPPSDADWRTGVIDSANSLRDALLAYRDGAEVVASTLALGLGNGEARTRLVQAIACGPFDHHTAQRAAYALLHFVLGHVSHEQQRLQYDSAGVLATELQSIPMDQDSAAEEYAFGIDLLINGLDTFARNNDELTR